MFLFVMLFSLAVAVPFFIFVDWYPFILYFLCGICSYLLFEFVSKLEDDNANFEAGVTLFMILTWPSTILMTSIGLILMALRKMVD